jgi:hypothetical protein
MKKEEQKQHLIDMMKDDEDLGLYEEPKQETTDLKLGINFSPIIYAGYYKIGGDIGIKIYLSKKPKWFHRNFTKLLLGWEWVSDTFKK